MKNISNGPQRSWLGFITMFVMPVLLWMYLFKDFLNGTITLNMDSYAEYSMFKFFYNNLFNGVIPIWDPFVVLGVPNIFILLSGVLSPLMALFACLHFLGVDYYSSFILFILFFFILGLAGFYLLALEMLEDRFYAWLAFIALLFSGMGPMLFNQIYIYFLFCPAVWMFYFLFCFSKKFEVKYFLGSIVTLMNMLCFYYPFYFLTAFLFFMIFLVSLYPMRFMDFAKGLKRFIVQHKKIFLSGVLFVVFALLPLVFFKVSLNGGDLLYLIRRPPDEKIVISLDKPDENSSTAMSFNEVSLWGTLGERMNGGRLFSHLDKYFYGSDSFFYIPVIIYIIIFVTAFVAFGRRQLLILCFGSSIFLLSLGQATPLHKIMYDALFYFKYFRNLLFFMAFLIPTVILFAMVQLKELLHSSQDHDKRWRNMAINTFLHLCFLCILFWHGNILMTSYLTVAISCLVFNLIFFRPKSFKIFFLLIFLLEPIQVFAAFDAHSLDYKFSAPAGHFASVFHYERPLLNQEKPVCIFPQKGNYVNFWYDLVMQDSTGYIADKPFVVSKFTYLLSKTIDENAFLNYIRHKFYIYDRVQFSKDVSNARIEEVLKRNENLVFVVDPLNTGLLQGNYKMSENPLIISRDSGQFKVLDFSPDRIQFITDFSTGKFLVYTDSYDKHWKVFINDHEQNLYRANMAFKGIFLPAGKNEVTFKYSIVGEKEMYLLLLFLNCLLLICFLRLLCLK